MISKYLKFNQWFNLASYKKKQPIKVHIKLSSVSSSFTWRLIPQIFIVCISFGRAIVAVGFKDTDIRGEVFIMCTSELPVCEGVSYVTSVPTQVPEIQSFCPFCQQLTQPSGTPCNVQAHSVICYKHSTRLKTEFEEQTMQNRYHILSILRMNFFSFFSL